MAIGIPTNTPPETNNTSATGLEDQVSIAVVLSGTDANGTVASFKLANLPLNGILRDGGGNLITTSTVIPATGNAATIYFTPTANWNGSTTFLYAATDNQATFDSSPATATITITPVNDPPVAVNDAGTTLEDTAITFTASQLKVNDSDPENDPLTITSVQGGVHGQALLNGDGTVTFTPEANYNGAGASFTYTISDGHGGTATATVNVTVTPVNDPPVAVNDAGSTPEDVPVTFTTAQLIVNDSDPDHDPLIIQSVQGADHGTVVLNADGTVTFTPAADYNGPASFKYTISDGHGGTATATVNVDVTPVNDPPVAVNDAGSTPEDVPVTFTTAQLIVNDSDPDHDPLAIQSVQDADHGTVVLNADGTVTFTPVADYNGPASFKYTISDGHGGTATATVNVDVTPVNDPPVAVNDAGSTPEDTPVTFTAGQLTGNDTDPEHDPLTITSVQAGDHGTVVLNPDGTVTFTPDADYNGPATFTYTIADGQGGTDTATVNVDVTPVNDPPVALNDAGTTAEDTPIVFTADQLLNNDSDPEGDALTITSVQGGTNGSAVLNADGTVTFTPTGNYNGPASFTYTISDGHGGTATAAVNVDVTPVNDPPTANDDAGTTPEDQPITFTAAQITGNDTDPDGDPLTITAVSGGANGTATLNLDGTVTFTPNANYNGPASFDYTVSDGHGGSDTATVNVTVTPVNDPPVAVNDAGSTAEDTPIVFTADQLTGNDTDPDGDTLTITGVSGGSHGTAVLNGDGTVTFTPTGNYNGPASFNYTISDGHGGTAAATVNIDVTPVNDAPETAPVSGSGLEDTPITIHLSGSDVDGTVVSFNIESLPVNGVLTDTQGHVLTAGSVVTATANGADVIFTPAPGWNGDTSFLYASKDDQGLVDPTPATANITITSVNDGPETADTSANGQADTQIAVTLSGSDTDGTVTTFTITDLPSNGVLTDAGGHVLGVGSTVAATGNAATIFFMPGVKFSGDVTFHYASTDNEGATDATPALGTITVKPPAAPPENKPPETANVSGSGAEDTVITIHLSGSDTDGTVTSFGLNSLPLHGVLKDAGGNVLTTSSVITATANGADVFFTPTANWNGQASFLYSSKDNSGAVDGTPATAQITVTSVNDAPTTNDVCVTGEACSSQIKVVLSGADSDGTVSSFTITTLPTDGVLKDGQGHTLGLNAVVTATNGTANVYFTPNSNWDGSTTFKYAAKDNEGLSDATPATATVQLAHSNQGPETNNTTASGNEDGGPIAVNLSGSDSDGQVVSFKITALPSHGVLKDAQGHTLTVGSLVTASGNGAVVYFTPAADWNGATTFTYASKDDDGATDSTPATAKITVNGANDAPDTCAVTASGCEDGGSISICLSGTDCDGNVASFTINDLPANGVLKDGAGHVITAGSVVTATNNGVTLYFTPNANWSGSTTFHYTAKDAEGMSDATSALAKVTVTAVNDAPTTNTAPAATGVEDGAAIKLTLTGADVDGTVSSFVISDLPLHGVLKTAGGVVLTAGMTVTATNGAADVFFTPTANWNGSTTFHYAAKDNGGAVDTSPSTGTFTVTAVNDGPQAVGDKGSTDVGVQVKFTTAQLTANDTDPDGDHLTITSVQAANHGVVSLAADGSVSFTPTAGYMGVAGFGYTVSDGHGGTATATVDINVSLPGAGVRAASFWAGAGKVYWDGATDAASDKHAPVYDNYPKAELTYMVDSNGDGSVDSKKFLLIGDFNKNGVADNGEHTYLISSANAEALLNATSSQLADGRFVVGKDLVTGWLNYLSENPVGAPGTANTPAWFIKEGVDWLSNVSGTVKTLSGGVQTDTGGMSNGAFVGGGAVGSSAAGWTAGYNLDGVSGIQQAGKDIYAGVQIHTALDDYNAHGTIGGSIWASDADLF
ncbi:MAG: thrombospondin [Phenylobacterium sp.]|nr:thrombospondin [Phenylobacterium sp.]